MLPLFTILFMVGVLIITGTGTFKDVVLITVFVVIATLLSIERKRSNDKKISTIGGEKWH